MAEKRSALITPVGRACFVHLDKAVAYDEDKEPKFGLMLVFTEEQLEALKPLRVACIKAAKEHFGVRYEKLKAKDKIRFPWRDAGDYDEYGEPFVEGNIMINLQSKTQPGVVDSRARSMKDLSQLYPGCFARASIAVWPYENSGNTGVTLLLNNVQKCSEGDKLAGSRSNPEDEFDAVEEGSPDDMDEDDDEDNEPAPAKKKSAASQKRRA